MSGFDELPILRIVPVGNLVLHEETDPHRVDALMDRIREDDVLKNPPIVTPMGDSEHYVVLDGANRTAALTGLGVRDAAIQVVDYGEVRLDTWNHVVASVDERALFQAIQRLPQVKVRSADLETARRLLRTRAILAYLVGRDGEVHVIEPGDGLKHSARALKRMSNVYRGEATIYRVQTDDPAEVLSYYDDVAATIIYPSFQPTDILELARNSAKLPTGITRHIIPRRALHINVALDFLSEDRSVEEKNQWLETWLRRKLQKKEVRYYEEPTVIFDE